MLLDGDARCVFLSVLTYLMVVRCVVCDCFFLYLFVVFACC